MELNAERLLYWLGTKVTWQVGRCSCLLSPSIPKQSDYCLTISWCWCQYLKRARFQVSTCRWTSGRLSFIDHHPHLKVPRLHVSDNFFCHSPVSCDEWVKGTEKGWKYLLLPPPRLWKGHCRGLFPPFQPSGNVRWMHSQTMHLHNCTSNECLRGFLAKLQKVELPQCHYLETRCLPRLYTFLSTKYCSQSRFAQENKYWFPVVVLGG